MWLSYTWEFGPPKGDRGLDSKLVWRNTFILWYLAKLNFPVSGLGYLRTGIMGIKKGDDFSSPSDQTQTTTMKLVVHI